MKKLLLLSSAVFALHFGASSQNGRQGTSQSSSLGQPSHGGTVSRTAASTPTVVVDTLHYYLNKYYFKTAISSVTAFPYYKSAASTVTNVTHCGSRIDVPAGDSVTVTGLEAYAGKHPQGANITIPVHLYLCNINSTTGMPILPPIDSVSVNVAAVPLSPPGTPYLIGGNFTHTTVASPTVAVATPHVMKSDFAVLFRNLSTVAGDTVRLLRTAGSTFTSNNAAVTKCSDFENGFHYGYVRYNGTFYSTANFTTAPGFGFGTEYEFIIAPRVTYQIHAGHLASQGILLEADSLVTPDTMCTREIMTFTNTSSKFYEHRMYNLNTFYRKWNLYSPFQAAPPGGFSSDSSITWHFEFYDAAVPAKDSRVFLPYVNNETITAQTDLAFYPDCFTANEFRARYRKMVAFGTSPQMVYNEPFKVCLRYCNGDTVGIGTVKGYESLSVYPNPAVNGKSTISGLQGTNTLVIYDLLGQVISSEVTQNPTTSVDLSKYPKGTYLVRIVSSDNKSKVVKIIYQN